MSLSILDKLPAPVRHTIIMLLGDILTTASIIQTGGSVSLSDFLHGLLGIAATQLVLFITPLTHQYGVGKK